MALCHNCAEVRDEYVGNGVQKEYEITFEYYDQDDVAVAFWNSETLVWEKIPNTDWVFQHETLRLDLKLLLTGQEIYYLSLY